MSRSKRFISKSKYLAGLQCDRLLWMYYHARSEIPAPGQATQAIFDQGHLVGAEARRLFPGGIEVDTPHTDIEGTIRQSLQVLKTRRPVFEAGLSHECAFARADILAPAPKDAWDLIEVKSSTEVKDINLEDVALQRYVFEGAGLNIRKCFLCHIDTEYVRHGEISPEGLFAQEDVTTATEEYLEHVPDNLHRMARIVCSKQQPKPAIGPHCNSPYPCPLSDKCHEHLPGHNVLTLTRIGAKGYDLLDRGILHVNDIPADVRLSSAQKIQADAVHTGEPYISRRAIGRFLDRLEYPLHFIDFETFQTAIPLYDGIRPYQQVPFQFSLHVQEQEGARCKHFGFLGNGKSDPRPELLSRLIPVIGTTGSLVAYNAPFEQSRLHELVEAYPSHASWWKKLEPRFVDLLAPFRSFLYYHPEQYGSTSLKSVLPVLCRIGYDGCAIADGTAASRAYLNLTTGKLDEKETGKVRGDLEKYCRRDTEAMVEIVHGLHRLV